MTAPAEEKVRLDLDRAGKCLEEALDMVENLDNVEVDIDQLKKNNVELAGVSRDLLRLAELCRLAAAEVYQQYWKFKGYTDPRDSK